MFGNPRDLQASMEAAARAAATFAQPVEGPSHRPAIRVIALVVVAVIVVAGARQLFLDGAPSRQALFAAGMVLLLLLWPLPGLMTGRTRIDARGISQHGFGKREVEWQQVQRVRFIRLGFSPRLVVSAGFGRMRVFYSGSRDLDEAFEHVVDVLTGPRK